LPRLLINEIQIAFFNDLSLVCGSLCCQSSRL
jgi:hypothetical protein